MKKMKKIALKSLLLLMVLSVMVLAGCGKDAPVVDGGNPEIPTEDGYSYENPEEAKAEPDAGFVIDGILDEEAYKNNNWLYLHNDDAGNDVDIAMTTYFGEKGMYFVYDVTESVPIYVNLERSPTLNSCIEMYLVPSDATNAKDNHFFEIDLLPTGDLYFKKSNGAYGYTDVSTTSDKMAVLGATTKGGEVNTPECYGYCLELFIPWDYMQWLGLDTDAMKNDFVLVNPAHITSHNFSGKDNNLDRYWYHYIQQCGIEFGDVAQYFRFDGNGVIGTVPVVLQQGENCTISGDAAVIPGMKTVVNIKPDDGYALNSILVDGEEEIQNVSYNEDGSVTLTVRSSVDGVNVSAKAEPVTEGKKTLSGKVVLHSLIEDDLEGMLISYIGLKGEEPVTIDGQGRFELKDMEPGYYVLKVEKEGYAPITRGIYLNRDIFTSLVLEYDLFVSTSGSSFIMDDQNDGILHKLSGSGHVMSNVSYNNFTYSVNLKYDEELAKQGKGDLYLQQRSGMRILFSNGKYWHIDVLKENGKYILQYAKHTGNDSIFNWKTVHKMDAGQVSRYTSEEGIELKIMRQGRYVAVWLGGSLIKVEVLNKQYSDCTAQVGVEAWISNCTVMEFPFSIVPHSTVNVMGSPFHIPAKSWGISGQYTGYVNRYPETKREWLDGQINTNDVTVIAKDLSPDTKDYSFAFIFKFSNKQQFRVRLNHTDGDGAYRIQSMAGSTVAPAWKNAYTLTPEEAERVKGDGIAYRVQILGTTAYVYLDGKEVCTYDLSTVVATGKPSGIEKATAKVSFALDGNMTGTTVIPFQMVDSTKNVTVKVAEIAGGTVLTDKESYKMGETVTLTLSGDPGYYYTELKINGVNVEPNWDGTYSFIAAENRYEVTAEFKPGKFAENANSAWELLKQNCGILKMNSHDSGNSGWLEAAVDGNDIDVLIRDASPDAKDFSMIYHFTFSNGETLRLRLNHTDSDGKYRVQVMSGSTVSAAWKNHHTLNDAQAAKIANKGINFRVVTKGGNALVYIDEIKVATLDLTKVVSTGEPSSIADSGVRVKIRVDGNLGQEMEIPFELLDTSKLVNVNIAEMTGGTVTADKNIYQLGETVTLTITPASGYSQRLYINGEVLKLDWKTNTYSFVADKNEYDITGSFEPSINAVAMDAGRWDSANQAHGILNAYYTANDDAWWMQLKGEYVSLATMIKNYLPTEDTHDGNGKVGFSVALRATMDNGKTYAFRIYNDKGTYAYSRSGASGSVAGWGNWKKLDDAAVAALTGDGVEFKLKRTAGNALTLYINGVVMDTYTMEGVTSANKVVSLDINHYGNKGQYIEIPFELKTPTDAPDVQLNIAEMTGGTVTADKESYKVGDTVTLTVTPDEGYAQKLYINGQPLMLDWKTNTYSFVATEKVYNITGSFEPALNLAPSDAGRWDTANQAHGVLNAYYPVNDDSWWMDVKGEYESITVKAKNYLSVADSQDGNGKVGFAVILRVTMDNGKTYAFRVYNDKGTYAHSWYGAGGSVTGWGSWKNIHNAYAADFNGDGVEYKLERTAGDKLTLSLNGTVVETYTMAGVTSANKVVSMSAQHNGNKGVKVEVPFSLTIPVPVPDVQLNIADLTNGTVTADKTSYKIGDTITLTVTPNAGYAQKLYINGKALKLDWKTNTYSFVATEKVYNITGSFEPSLNAVAKDAGRWDTANQAHGILNTYYPVNDDAWWMEIKGNYTSLSVKTKNYLPTADTQDGNGKVGYSIALRATMDNGKTYAFRIYNDKGTYAYSRSGASGSVAGWGSWKKLDDAAVAAITGEGVAFKLVRTGANTLTLYINGVVVDTYTMEGVTADNKVVSLDIAHYGNKGQKVEIPFTIG